MTHWREQDIVSKLREMMAEIRSPYVDGFTGSAVKRDLYRIKCFLEDEYPKSYHISLTNPNTNKNASWRF